MITIQDEPTTEPRLSIADFDVGDTFKCNARYYLVVMIEDEGAEIDHKTAVDLGSGAEIGKYKRTRPCLYPVDLEMRVVET